jgi:hypothetical protein
MLAQKINQQRSRFDNGVVLYAIDGDSDWHRCIFRLSSHAQNSSVNVAWFDPKRSVARSLPRLRVRENQFLHPIGAGLKTPALELNDRLDSPQRRL